MIKWVANGFTLERSSSSLLGLKTSSQSVGQKLGLLEVSSANQWMNFEPIC